MSAFGINLRPASELSSGEPGLYLDVPFGEYLKYDAVSNSTLKRIEQAAGQVIWAKEAPIDEEAKSAAELGTLVHCLALEPEEFNSRYLVMPELNLRTNADKARLADFEAQAEATGLIALNQDDLRKARLMVGSLLAYPDIKMQLKSKNGYSEATVIWVDQETGLKCKARVDRLTITPEGDAMALDLKTISDMKRLKWDIRDFGYAQQDIHYSEGLMAIGFPNVWFRFAFVSSGLSLKRYPVKYGCLRDNLRREAYEIQRARLEKYLSCLELDEFFEEELLG